MITRPSFPGDGRNAQRTEDQTRRIFPTSYAERHNLTMRMAMRRFTRLTNAFSKKFESHVHMVALYTDWYNFVRQNKAHKLSPAMAAGVADRLWGMADIAALVEAAAPKPGPRGRYKSRALGVV